MVRVSTLINISDVEVRDNISANSNRPAIYLENCGDIDINGNRTDNEIEIVHRFEDIRLSGNTFSNLRMLANATGKTLKLDHNTAGQLFLPNGLAIDSLVLTHNRILNGSLNINFPGHVVMRANEIKSQSPLGAILIVRAQGAVIDSNKVISSAGAALVTRKSASNISITNNRIQSVDACVVDDGSDHLYVKGNTFVSLKGGAWQRTFTSTNPSNLVLQNNEHHGGKNDNSIRLHGDGTATITDENIVSGYPDYGNVHIKPAP